MAETIFDKIINKEIPAEILYEDDFQMDVSLDGLTVIERWEDGVRTDQKNEFLGQGTFGLNEEDENSSIMINGTIHELHWLTEDGITLSGWYMESDPTAITIIGMHGVTSSKFSPDVFLSLILNGCR